MSLYEAIEEIGEKNRSRKAGVGGEISGVVVGIVTKNSSSENKGRVCVKIPSREDSGNILEWVKVAMPMSGKNWGCYFIPEIGDEVLVAFEYGSVENPYVIGCIPRADSRLVTQNYDDDNDNKVMLTKGGNSIDISDKDGKESITLTTKAEQRLILDDGNDKITIKDKNGSNHIELDTKGGNLEIEVKSKITLKAGKTTIEINGSSDTVTIKCQQFNAETKRGIKFKTSALNLSASSLNASATGTATIKSNSVLSVKGQSIILG